MCVFREGLEGLSRPFESDNQLNSVNLVNEK